MKKNIVIVSIITILGLAGCTKNDGNGGVTIPGGGNNSSSTTEDPTMPEPTAAVIGKPLPAWSDGCLDIHSINTGRGESTFYILPDGTTMLIDAAGSLLKTSDKPPTAPKPNDNITSGAVIIDYIKAYMPSQCNGTLDYLHLSHFHGDHMGSWSTSCDMHAGGFRINGITEVGSEIPFAKIFDRGTPVNRKASDMITSQGLDNYFKFVDWAKKEYAAEADVIKAGRNDQIVLTHNPEKFSSFSVRNIASNGDVWNGFGNTATSLMPSAEELISYSSSESAALPYENSLSACFHIKYGSFDYFCGGDIQYNGRSSYGYKDIELPISKVVKKVEVMKASHHGTANTNGKEILAALKPDAVVINVWRNVQPNYDTIKRMYDANSKCNIFTTNLTDDNKVVLSDFVSKFNATQGHIVIRVHPNGGKYYIYVLDDTDLKRNVKRIFGPYHCS